MRPACTSLTARWSPSAWRKRCLICRSKCIPVCRRASPGWLSGFPDRWARSCPHGGRSPRLSPRALIMSEWARGIANALGILIVLVALAALLTWVERRLLGFFQDRYGPNRVGPFGVFQVVADMIKILFKEDWIPPFADRAVFVLAPMIVMAVLLIAFAVIPIAPDIGVVSLNIGLLFFLAMTSLAVYSTVLGGWASNNKYSLMGGARAAAQMVSYEVFMGLSLVGVVLMAGSFDLTDIVRSQRGVW